MDSAAAAAGAAGASVAAAAAETTEDKEGALLPANVVMAIAVGPQGYTPYWEEGQLAW